MNKLQKSLLQNVLFSGLSGIALITLNQQIAQIFETSNTAVFWSTGCVLLLFASTIMYEIFKQRPIGVLWIIVQDFLWVIGSFVLITIQPFDISKAGNSAIGITACIVLYLAIFQSKALAQVDQGENPKNKLLKFERIIQADKQAVWKVIADVANYDKVAPNIDAVKIVSGEGRGMVRTCSHGKDSWSETCSMWIEEKAYSFEVNTTAPDYPYPFHYLKGTWEVQELDSATTKVTMLFDFQYARNYQNWLIHPLLKGKFSKTAEELLGNWQAMLEKKDGKFL